MTKKLPRTLRSCFARKDLTLPTPTQGEAISVLDGNRFDLALVDISLPDGNGFTVCTEIKQAQNIPVIFLTASGDEASVVTGCNMGSG